MQNQQNTGALYPTQQHHHQQITNNNTVSKQSSPLSLHHNNPMTAATSNPPLATTHVTAPSNLMMTNNNLFPSPPLSSSTHHLHQTPNNTTSHVSTNASSWSLNFQQPQQHTFSNVNGGGVVQQQHQQAQHQHYRQMGGSLSNYHQIQQQHSSSDRNTVPSNIPTTTPNNNTNNNNTNTTMNNNQGIHHSIMMTNSHQHQQQNMFNSLMQHQQMNNTNMMNNNYNNHSNQPYNQQQHLISSSNNGNNFQMVGSQMDSSLNNSTNLVSDSMINPSQSSHLHVLHHNNMQQQHQQQLHNSDATNDNIFSVNSFFRHANNDGIKHAQPMQNSPSTTNRVLQGPNSTSSTPISFTTPTMVKVQNNTQPKWSIQQTTVVQPAVVKSETSPNQHVDQPQQQNSEDDIGVDQEAGQKGGIKITRNIRADTSVTPTEPVEYPKHGVLYIYNVENWADKNSFYDKIAYSFGTPSTQKKVHCSYLNCKVMHYERTCQGVYYCPHKDDDGNSCIVRPCRLRFHTCQKHNNNSLTKSGKCPFKLHFYVPLDKTDNRRLLLCLGAHNHPLLSESDGMIISSQSSEKKAKQVKPSTTIIQLNQEPKQHAQAAQSSSVSNGNGTTFSEPKQSMSRVSSSNSVQSVKKKANPNIPTIIPSGNANGDNISTSTKAMKQYNQPPTNFIMNNMSNSIPSNMSNNIPNMANNMQPIMPIPSTVSSNKQMLPNNSNHLPNNMQNIPNIQNNMQNNMASGMPPNMSNNMMKNNFSNGIPNNMMNNMPGMSNNSMMNNIPQNNLSQNLMEPYGNNGSTMSNANIHHLSSSNLLSSSNSISNIHYPSASDTLMSPPPKTTLNLPSMHRSASQEILSSSIVSGTGLTPPARSSPLGGQSPSLSPPYSYSSPHNSYSQAQTSPQSNAIMNTSSVITNTSTVSSAPKKFTSLFQPSDYLQHVSKPPSYSKTTTPNSTGENDPKRSSSLMSSSPNFMSSSSPSLYSFSNSPSPRIPRSPSYHNTPSPPHMLVSPMNPSGFPALSPSYFYDNNYSSPLHSSPQPPIPQSPSKLIYKTETSGIKRERAYNSDDANTKKVKQEEDSVLPPIESIVD